MDKLSPEWMPPRTQTALKAAGIILAYSAVIIGYLALAIWGAAGTP